MSMNVAKYSSIKIVFTNDNYVINTIGLLSGTSDVDVEVSFDGK